MLQKFNTKLALLAALAMAFLTAPGLALASGGGGVDVSEVVSAIEGADAPIAAIGLAVLGILVAIKVYKWVRRAM